LVQTFSFFLPFSFSSLLFDKQSWLL
jgi:hypothetical protein